MHQIKIPSQTASHLSVVESQIAWPLPFTGAGHVLQLVVPQLSTLVLLEQPRVPPQSCVPLGQPQLPAMHLLPAPHTVPQPPQLLLSELVSTHAFEHNLPLLQRMSHAKPSQIALPLPDSGSGHVELQAKRPHEVSAVLLTQVPLQACIPDGQTH